MSVRNAGGRWLVSALAALLLMTGLSATVSADLRIVHESDDGRTAVLVKGNRIVWDLSPQDWIMIDCVREEVTLVQPSRYWQGSIVEIKALFAELRSILSESMAHGLGAEGSLGSVPGSRKSETIQVRVTRLEDETIAGYRATQYRVETGDGSHWKTFEDIWFFRDLLREIESEIGRCSAVLMDLTQEFANLMPMGEALAVYSDPSYRTLFHQGFPMRSITKVSMFGTDLEIQSEVVEISRAPLEEARFTVPSTYQRYDDLYEFLEL